MAISSSPDDSLPPSPCPSPSTYQLFLRDISGRTILLRFPSPQLAGATLLTAVASLTAIPPHEIFLLSGSHVVTPSSILSTDGTLFSSCRLSLRLRGGKGGFGSLLRGAASKAGQKKTNNFDACRDISGRRLRHVNAEKRIEEWRAEAEDRKLEKMAEEFLKNKARETKKGGGEKEVAKYVEKFREDAEKCAEEVERSVRDSLKKRKGDLTVGSSSKRLKIWLGKKKVNEDSDSSDEDDEGGDAVDEHSGDSNRNEDMDSVILDADDGLKVSDNSEKESAVLFQNSGSETLNSEGDTDANVKSGSEESPVLNQSSESETSKPEPDMDVKVQSGLTKDEHVGSNGDHNLGMACDKREIPNEVCLQKNGSATVEELLELSSFDSAVDLEALGLERLKMELQFRGLKCGGSLQERASRLFLLKTTPFDKLPKKLLAKQGK